MIIMAVSYISNTRQRQNIIRAQGKGMANVDSDENQIRSLVENWAKAVRDEDIDGILAHHTDDIVMFDVPAPFQSKGITAYRKTWDTFHDWAKDLVGLFDILEIRVIAGSSVAFCYASMR